MKPPTPKSHAAIMKVAINAAKKGKKPPKGKLVDADGDVDFTKLASRRSANC